MLSFCWWNLIHQMPSIVPVISFLSSKSSRNLQCYCELIKKPPHRLISSIPIHHTRKYYKRKRSSHLIHSFLTFTSQVNHSHQISYSFFKSSWFDHRLKIIERLIKILMPVFKFSVGRFYRRFRFFLLNLYQCWCKFIGINLSKRFIIIIDRSKIQTSICSLNIINNIINFWSL